MALGETARLIASLELDPRKFTKGLSDAEKRLGKAESTAFRTGQHLGVGIKNIARLGVAAAGSISAISIASLNVAGDFEAQLNTINTIAHKTPAELAKIGDSIRGIAKATGTPLEELTQGFYDLLSAGVSAAGAQRVLVAANKLAIGGLASTAETVDLLTTAINTYGLHSRDAAKVADIFAKAVERGKVTAAELAQSFAIVGPIAASAGISISEVSAAYARLTASGVPAAEAATQTRAAIQALAKQTPALKKLSKQTGINYLALAGKKGLVVALQQMRTDAEKAGVKLPELTGRIEAQNFILATTGPNFRKYNADLAAMGKASGTAAAQMAERQKGLNFQLDRLKALAKDAGIVIGSELLPKITPLFERLNKAFADPKTQAAIRDFGDKIAALFSDQNIQTGIDALEGAFNAAKEAAPVLADSLKISGAALKIAVDAFKSLPPDIQKLAIVALATNKLTGGLVTTLAGGLISAILGSLKSAVVGITAAQVNVTGPVTGVPGSTPGAAGKGVGDLVKAAPAAIGLTGAASLTIAAIAPLALGELALAIAQAATGKTTQQLDNESRLKTAVARGVDEKLVPAVRDHLPGEFGKPLNALLEDSRRRTQDQGRDADRAEQLLGRQIKAAEDIKRQESRSAQEDQRRGERIVQTGKDTKAAIDASKARLAAVMTETQRETNRGIAATGAATAAAARAAGERARAASLATAEAVRRQKLRTNVTVVNRLNLSIRDTQRKLSFSQNMAIYG